MRSTPLLALVAFACTPPPEHLDASGRPLSTDDWQELGSLTEQRALDLGWIERPLVPGLEPSWQALRGLTRVYAGARGLTLVDRRHVEPEWVVELELDGIGRGSARRPAGPATVWADGTSFEALHDGVVEYLEQGPQGLEHGFRVLEDPGGSGPLVLDLRVSGARPHALDDGAAFVVRGVGRIDWRGLAVYDADHRRLDAHTEAVGAHLRVEISDRGARFPIVVDPMLTLVPLDIAVTSGAPDPSALGFSIDSDGDRIVAGDPGVGPALDGVAQVVQRNQDGADRWGLVSTLQVDQLPAPPHQAFAVALEGDTLAVSSELSGMVTVFHPDSGGWTAIHNFNANNVDYGWALDVEDQAVFIGAPGDGDAGLANSGAVFVKAPALEIGAGWTSEKVVAPWRSGRFGEALSASGGRLAVGAPLQGTVVLYRFDRGYGAAPTPVLELDRRSDLPGFGTSVALDHDVLAVGAPGSEVVVMYEGEGSGDLTEQWGDGFEIHAPPGAGENFGIRVAVTSDTVAVMDLPSAGGVAKVHLFERRSSQVEDQWGWVESLEAGVAGLQPLPVTLEATQLAVGVPDEHGLRVWRREAGEWTTSEQAGESGQGFGSAVAVSGNMALVGVPNDDVTAPGAGSVAAFTKERPGAWALTATAPGTFADEAFGTSVDLDSDLAAVGAPRYDRGADYDAGRVAILRFDGVAFLNEIASIQSLDDDKGAQDFFGGSVALDQELLVVGQQGSHGELYRGSARVFRRNPAFDVWSMVFGTTEGNATLDEMGSRVALWSGWAFTSSGRAGGGRGEVWIDQVYAPTAVHQVVSGLNPQDNFGAAMSVDGGILAVGAPGALSGAGRVHLFQLVGDPSAPWQPLAIVNGSAAASRFGTAVALRGDDLFVGAPGIDVVRHHRRNVGGAEGWGFVDEWLGTGPAAESFGEHVDADDSTLAIGSPSAFGTGHVHLAELGADLPPIAVADTYQVLEDGLLQEPAPGVLENDHDPNGGALTLALVTSPAHDDQNSFVLRSDGSFTYNSELNYNGSDSFRYSITDGTNTAVVVTVTLDVVPVNDPPQAHPDGPWPGTEDADLVSPVSVLANDDDPDSTMTAEVEVQPVVGQLDLRTDGTFTYSPPPNRSGPISFTYVAVDETDRSAPVTVDLEIVPSNDPPRPQADPEAVVVPEDTSHLADAPGLLSDTWVVDPDGDPLIAELVAGEGPSHGGVSVRPDGRWSYVPAPDYVGLDEFSFVARDATDSTAPILVRLVVTAVNDAPVASPDGEFHTREDTTLLLTATQLLGNDRDVEEQLATLVLEPSVTPTLGSLTLDAINGVVTYSPSPDVSGTDYFAYRAVDEGGARSEPVLVTVVVDDVNDRPIAVADEFDGVAAPLAGNVLDNDHDPEGTALTATLLRGPVSGTVDLDPDGTFEYTPRLPGVVLDAFRYAAMDADGAVSEPAWVEVVVRGEEPEPEDTGGTPCQPTIWYADADGDGFGDPDQPREGCEAPDRHVADRTDCDDTRAESLPGGVDEPGDGLDQDCDGHDSDPTVAGACDTAPGTGWPAVSLLVVAGLVRRGRRR